MLSICIITKNEGEKLNRCLRALGNFEAEVVVVDTGSSDNTFEILRDWERNSKKKFKLKKDTFVWRDDFAAAKNYAVSLAQSDIVFVLDSDEVVENMDLAALEKLFLNGFEKIGRVVRRNQIEQNGQINYQREYIARVFDRTRYQYSGRIHEQLIPVRGGGELTPDLYVSLPISIWHDGYMGTPEQRKEKAKRNIALLKRELAEEGEDPYVLYQLGKSYYMQGAYREAAEYFSRGLTFDLNPSLEYVTDMVETYGYALLNAGRAGEALMFENIYDVFGNTADFRLLMGLIYMNNEMFEEAVAEFQRAAQCENARMQGANSFLAFYNAGVIRECLGDKAQAIRFYKKCGDYALARERLASLEE